MKKIILMTLLPLSLLMGGSFVMSKGKPLIKAEEGIAGSEEDISNLNYERIITVNSIEKLENEVNSANISTKIIVDDMTISNHIILKGNTASVLVIAKNPFHVIIQGVLDIKSDNLTLQGFKFQGGSNDKRYSTKIFGNNVHITKCLWNDARPKRWLITDLQARKLEVSYCTFMNKFNNTIGNTQRPREVVQLNFDYKDLQPHNHFIHHNHWKNIPKGKFSNSYEALQVFTVEDGKEASINGAQQNTRVEYNLFEDVEGEGEIISVKSNNCYIKYNTFKGCRGAVTLRFGNNSEIVKNSIFGQNKSVGFTLNGENHKIINNYVENSTREGILLRDGDNYWAGYTKPINVLIKQNIILNCKKGNLRFGKIKHPKATEQYPPEDTIVQNNILLQKQGYDIVQIGHETINPIAGIQFINNEYKNGLINQKIAYGFTEKNYILREYENGFKAPNQEIIKNIAVITTDIAGVDAR